MQEEDITNMKTYKLFAMVLAAVCALGLLTACQQADTSTSTPSPSSNSAKWFTEPKELEKGDNYVSSEYYLHNEVTDRHIYAVETKPTGLTEDEKVPLVIYTHGQSGYATNFSAIYTKLAEEKIAAFSFECCGGNRSGAKSEGSKLFPANYTSRITDLETVIAKVKTLDYVDQDRVFLFGESYGGIVSSLVAIDHNEFPGLILLSTGIDAELSLLGHEEGDVTYLPEYDPDDPLEAIKGYEGDVICFNGQQDFAHDYGKHQIDVYNQREKGSAVFYSLENSDHSFSALSPEAQQFLIETMTEFVLAR